MKITVLGSGGWGTALALVLLENGHEVTLWSYTEAESAVLRQTRENPMLKGVSLPESLGLTTFSDAFTFALLIIILVAKPTGLFGEKATDKV